MNIKDFKWTEKRFGTTFANILKKLGGLSKDSTDGSIEYKDEQGNVTKLVTDSNFSSLLAKNGLIEVKWQELKDKRDNGQLIPGSLYRITDYNCTTTQENTRSAGHQFDIVLLALSENKLAEEGWAMMNESNIYDVTFADGVTKKCWIYETTTGDRRKYNVVDINTKIGASNCYEEDDITINEQEKTAIIEGDYDNYMTEENLPYNYFQNSNLSAWKVWYCLDNDKDRFAWADDSVDEGSPASIEDSSLDYERYIEGDKGGKYAWHNSKGDPSVIYTDSEEPIRGDYTYIWFNIGQDFSRRVDGDVTSFIPGHEGTNLPNGRGVIYRLIDEWGNDVGYDFKNIQFVRKVTGGGLINPSTGINTWVYTFSVCDDNTKELSDYSVTCKTFLDDAGDYSLCYENKIKSATSLSGSLYILNDVVFHILNVPNDTVHPLVQNICEGGCNVTIGYGNSSFMGNIFIYANDKDYNRTLSNDIVVQNTRATFENIT